ncbi:pentapeptide repeat-containing protein [Streptomyces physcomitrii]
MDFRKADLRGADLRGADLRGSFRVVWATLHPLGRDRAMPRRISAWWPLYRRSSAFSCSASVWCETAAE